MRALRRPSFRSCRPASSAPARGSRERSNACRPLDRDRGPRRHLYAIATLFVVSPVPVRREESASTVMSFPAQEILVTEHLTFAPLSLVDDIINTANALLYKAVNAMEQLFTNLPAQVIPDEEVETGIHKFETLLENAVDRNFDAMELFVLRNIVNIPDDLIGWVQLRHHVGLDFGSDDSAEVEEDLLRARKTYTASQKVAVMLERERALNNRKLALLDAHAAKLQFLEDVARANDVGSVKDSSGFVREQIMALQTLLNETTELSSALEIALEASDRSNYIEEVILSTIKEGSYEQDLAEANKIGTVENIQNAVAVLKANKKG